MDPKTSQASTSTASIFLPHTMCSALYEHYPTKWAELFCPPKLEEFWKGVENKKDDRLKGHPLKKREDWRTQTIPIFVHGDGAEFMTRDSLMIYSFGCVLNWCFKSEDFVGAIARLAHSCTSGVASTRLSTKVLPKYAILLHLLLTREGFSIEG